MLNASRSGVMSIPETYYEIQMRWAKNPTFEVFSI